MERYIISGAACTVPPLKSSNRPYAQHGLEGNLTEPPTPEKRGAYVTDLRDVRFRTTTSEMAAQPPAFNAELRFVEERPGKGAMGGERVSVVRSHVARFRHRRRRDAEVRAFQESEEEAERREEGEVEALAAADGSMSMVEGRLVKTSLRPSLPYQDNRGWYLAGLCREHLLICHSDPVHFYHCIRACSHAPPRL